jgi:hypothetical protein
MDRDDLVFATCHQIGGLIKESWDDALSHDAVYGGLILLTAVDDPDTNMDNKALTIAKLELAIRAFKAIISYSDDWKDDEAEMLKKEMLSRIRNYERRSKQLTRPLIDLGNLELHT